MNIVAWQGVLIPFIGTSLGAACVFFLRGALRPSVRRALGGFAAGVMTAASVWSLLIPALESADAPLEALIPALSGFWAGVLFLRLLDRAAPMLRSLTVEGDLPRSTASLVLAVTIHNLPEGMAVGAVCAGLIRGEPGVTASGALALALGIAIQNFPEGAIISMPLRAAGMPTGRSFFWGVLSGAVEPLGALLTIWLSGLVVPLLPVTLSFAAGAMIGVVVEELIPEAMDGANADATIFALGFTAMMALDVALG